MAEADDGLDALLDDALDCYEQAQEKEEARQEERKKEKEKAATEDDDGLTALLEKTLATLQDGGGEGSQEDADLQDLVQQGLNLMKGDCDEADEQEMFKKCLGLLDQVTKEMGKEDGTPDAAGLNPFMQQLSKTVGDVIKGLEDGADPQAPPSDEQQHLLDMMKGLNLKTDGPDGALPADLTPEALKGIMGDFGNLGGGSGAFEKAISGEIAGNMQEGEDPATVIKNLKKELEASDELAPEMKAMITDMIKNVEKNLAEVQGDGSPEAESSQKGEEVEQRVPEEE